MNTIYKTAEAKATLMQLYKDRLDGLNLDQAEIRHLDTSAGKTQVILAGNPDGPKLLVLHGIHAGAPMTLEAMQALLPKYRVVAVDTVGQATRSAETVLSMKDDSYGRWLVEVLDQLKLETVRAIGVSYGGFLLQRLMALAPERIEKAVLVVPMGVVSGSASAGFFKLSIPLIRFLLFKKEKRLVQFLTAFYGKLEPRDILFQRTLLLGVKMDFRRPPLIQPEEMAALKAPVYLIYAEDDVFIPGEKVLARCRKVYPTLQDQHILSGSKHIPGPETFAEICAKIDSWMEA